MADGELLLDTNVLIYGLKGTSQYAVELLADRPRLGLAVSVVSWIELLVGTTSANNGILRDYLERFEVVRFTQEIAERTIQVRKQTRLKLPDAIIYASALATGRTLVTYNTRDFPLGTPSVHNPEA